MSDTQAEILFVVRASDDGGLIAESIGPSIFTEADDEDDLRQSVRDAVACHFPDPALRPKSIRLHFVRDEVIAA